MSYGWGKMEYETSKEGKQMSRAEEAVKSQKVKDAANDYCSAYYDWHNRAERIAVTSTFKQGYFEGYEQAEKDLALTWEDMEKISDLLVSCYFLWFRPKKDIMEQSFYEEVLRRFNEYKSKKNESE